MKYRPSKKALGKVEGEWEQPAGCSPPASEGLGPDRCAHGFAQMCSGLAEGAAISHCN